MPRSKNKSSSQKRKKWSSLFLAVGLTLLFLSLLLRIHYETRLSFTTPIKEEVKPHKAESPISLEIEKIDVQIPIEETSIRNGVWEISKKGASHLATSANPGETGTIILYAHNTKKRFGRLPSLKKGDEITLNTKDRKIHTYKVKEALTVRPDKIEVLKSVGSEMLVLYTCSGFADSQRYIVKATPI